MTTKLDSSKFTKAELDIIVNAFADIADTIDTHDFEAQTGVGDKTAEANYGAAKELVYKKYYA